MKDLVEGTYVFDKDIRFRVAGVPYSETIQGRLQNPG